MSEGIRWTSGTKSFGITAHGYQIIRCRKGGITSNPMVWKVYDRRGFPIGDYPSEELALAATVA